MGIHRTRWYRSSQSQGGRISIYPSGGYQDSWRRWYGRRQILSKVMYIWYRYLICAQTNELTLSHSICIDYEPFPAWSRVNVYNSSWVLLTWGGTRISWQCKSARFCSFFQCITHNNTNVAFSLTIHQSAYDLTKEGGGLIPPFQPGYLDGFISKQKSMVSCAIPSRGNIIIVGESFLLDTLRPSLCCSVLILSPMPLPLLLVVINKYSLVMKCTTFLARAKIKKSWKWKL